MAVAMTMACPIPAFAITPIGHDAAACIAGDEPAILVLPEGLKDRKGELRLELYPDNDADFLQDDKILIEAGRTFRRVDVPTPASGPIALCIRAPRPGRYTLMLLHDRDSNRKFGAFVDGAGFPGNPRLGFGRPRAAQALITVGHGVTTTRIVLNYFHGLSFSPLRKKD
jgi:uncharacterized protein (DUF2141 family)